jgi:hypothetical protein
MGFDAFGVWILLYSKKSGASRIFQQSMQRITHQPYLTKNAQPQKPRNKSESSRNLHEICLIFEVFGAFFAQLPMRRSPQNEKA